MKSNTLNLLSQVRHLFAILMLTIAFIASPAASSSVFAANNKPSAAQQRQKAMAQKNKQRQQQMAKAKKEREQKAKQAAKDKAKKDANKKDAKEVKQTEEPVVEETPQEPETKAQSAYRQKLEAAQRYNARIARYQARDIHHSLGVWGYAGYSALFQKYPTTLNFSNNLVGGIGGGVGLGYQLLYKHFLFNTGLEFEMYNSADRIFATDGNPFSENMPLLTAVPGNNLTYTLNPFTDNYSLGYIDIPLLFGGQWNAFYFLVGPKIGYSLIKNSTAQATLSTALETADASLSNLVISDQPLKYSEKLSSHINLAAHAEIGLFLDQWLKPQQKQQKGTRSRFQRGKQQRSFADIVHLRLGVFADYGVLNIQNSANASHAQTTPVLPNVTAPANSQPLPVLTINPAQNMRANPFLVGVKLAMFFELPRKQKKLMSLPAEPLPSFATKVVDEETGKPLQGAMISVFNPYKGKVTTKTTNKSGLVMQRYKNGQYKIWAKHAKYFETDTVYFDHQKNLKDTVILSLKPTPEGFIEGTSLSSLTGVVRDADTQQPLDADIIIRDLDMNTLYEGQAADDGLFVTPLPAGDYVAHLSRKGYMPADDTLHFSMDTIFLTLQRIEEGKKVILYNMFFATNKTQILQVSQESLDALLSFMTENPGVEVHITGHTDAVGSDESNQRLSENRAKAVRKALILSGIDGSRITYEGRGESEPVDTNETEEGRAKNRRVEIEVTSTGELNAEQIQVKNDWE